MTDQITDGSQMDKVNIYRGIGDHIVIYCQPCKFLLTGAPTPEAAVQVAEWHRAGMMQSGRGLARPRDVCTSSGIHNELAADDVAAASRP